MKMFNCMISESLVTCFDVTDLGTIRRAHFELTFKSDVIWNHKGKKGRHWGYLDSTKQVGDQVIRMYSRGDHSVGCSRSSKLTYRCGDETKLTRVYQVRKCYYEIDAEVVCNQVC